MTEKYTQVILPEFVYRKAFVIPGCAFYGSIVALMASCGFKQAASVEDADVVVFGGGSDINPSLYGDEVHPRTHYNEQQDALEVAIYHEAKQHNKVMFGICRGAQLLHAMNGGRLYQDVNKHGGTEHVIYDMDDDVTLSVNSLHHQMLIPNGEIDVIAVCHEQQATTLSTMDKGANVTYHAGPNAPMMEIEAGYHSSSRCFFVQGHPEIGSDIYRSWTMNKLYDFMISWEEFDYLGDD